MTTVAISDPTREKLGYLNNGNEKFGETVERLIDEEIKRKKIVIPDHLKV